jgi:hypothetical protein
VAEVVPVRRRHGSPRVGCLIAPRNYVESGRNDLPRWRRSFTTVSILSEIPSRGGVRGETLVDAGGDLRCSAQIGKRRVISSLAGGRTRSTLATWHTLQVTFAFLFSVIQVIP